jgi:hypothetical protein
VTGAKFVGPIFQVTSKSQAMLSAIRELNPSAQIIDRGSYVRILSPDTCQLTRQALERYLGGSCDFRGEVEQAMCSFQGHFSLTDDEARWDSIESKKKGGS